MSHSLIPERAVLVSPSLAASIGLEEAILLQHLENCCQLMGYQPGSTGSDSNGATGAPAETLQGLSANFQWARGSLQGLAAQLPFWTPAALRRILQSLVDLGMLVLDTFPHSEAAPFAFAVNQQIAKRPAPQQQAPAASPTGGHAGLGGHRINANWQPDASAIAQLQQQGISPAYTLAAVDEFVLYWRERNEISYSWSSKFLQHVSRRWQQQQQREQDQKNQLAQREARSAPAGLHSMQTSWQPSLDAVEILQRMGIHQNFIDDAVPEFVLYWAERGDAQATWNSKFVTQVKRQWARYTHTLKHDTEPVPMHDSWQPDEEVFDVLVIANIDGEFARSLIPEFMMYWRDKKELHHSWNTKFLQYVKYQWSRNYQAKERNSNGTPGQAGEKRRTRDRTLIEDLTDRSWAS